MKRVLVATASCGVVALAGVLLVQHAASQPRITTTRQVQVLGAAANNHSHGAWFVDLQSNSVIFCERVKGGTQCHTTAIP
jgi:hypothetical protein